MSNSPVIWLIDDDEDDVYLFKRALQSIGREFSFLYWSDGQKIVDHLKNMSSEASLMYPDPSVIFLDLNMPRMSGSDALDFLRTHSRLKRCPVIIYSTSTSEEEIKRCYENGANAFITKPANLVDMITTMDAVWNFWFGPVSLPQHD